MEVIRHVRDAGAGVKIILASKSPRRQELLKNIGLEFEVRASRFDEKSVSCSGIAPHEYAEELARRKAGAVAETIRPENGVEYLVVGADTIVVLDGCVLGQPADEADARRMLEMLSGKANQVITGVCVVGLKNGEKTVHSAFESTLVYFKKLSRYEIERYAATKEPLDKAGAYGIQGLASLFVEKIDGCYFNVVGLPLMKLSTLFARCGYSLI